MTLLDDQAVIERMKQSGGNVTVGGVRFAPAPLITDAYELGRKRENEDGAHHRDALRQIRDLLWQGRHGQPGFGSQQDMDAIVDAVRVLLESAQAYDKRFAEVTASARATYESAASLNQERALLERRIRHLDAEVERMKAALAGERDRGYTAALADVRRAAKRIKEERE